MFRHDPVDAAEWAALHACGALTPDEQQQFDQHVSTCEVCREQLSRLGAVGEALFETAEAVSPPVDVRARLLARVAASPLSGDQRQIWRRWADANRSPELVIERASRTAWEETGIPGIRMRRLLVDRERDRFTALVEMDAGSAYPAHKHNGPEECLVLAGELLVGEERMYPGDYQYAPVGTHHPVQRTDKGCKLLIVSSMSDDLE